MMVGKIFKMIMFGRFSWLKYFFDLVVIKYFVFYFIMGVKSCGDDLLLMIVIWMMVDKDIEMVLVVEFVFELFVEEGCFMKCLFSCV